MRSERSSERGGAPAAIVGDDPPYGLILRQRALWGGMLGTFCSNYAFYFVFSWLPLYLVNERGLSLTEMTPVATAFYVFDAASVLADRLPARSMDPARSEFQSRIQDRAVPQQRGRRACA